MKQTILIAAVLVQMLTGAAHAANEAEVAGLYENQSESSFVFTLKLEKAGRAIYTEPDSEGGKSFVRTGSGCWPVTVSPSTWARMVATPMRCVRAWPGNHLGARAAALGWKSRRFRKWELQRTLGITCGVPLIARRLSGATTAKALKY